MTDSTPPPRHDAQLCAGGAIAQGDAATALGEHAVMVGRDSHAPISTGSGDIYQNVYNQAAQPGAGAAVLRRAYLAWLSLRANELPLFAGDSGRQAQLSSVYTALLTRNRDDRAMFSTDAAKDRDRTARVPNDARRSALDALDEEQYLVLMGGPGSGKTTFLNFVALCLAGELLGHASNNLACLRAPIPPDPSASDAEKPRAQRWTHEGLLPVRVVLRDFAADLPPPRAPVTADNLWRFIVKQLPELLQCHADDLQAELLEHGGLILLDGLDEVPDALSRREQVKQAIQEFAGVYRGCRFLATSRTYAYQRQDWKLDGFAERELLPFTRGQIERFIDTWYAHMSRDLFRLTEADASARAEVLKRATRRDELRELAERPLLLTLMARLQTKGGGSLPENREGLYSQSVDMLLDEWEGLKISHDAQGNLIVIESLSEWLSSSRESIRRELDKLAYQAHLDQPSLVGTADIRQTDLIAALMTASRDQPDTKLIRLEEYLRDRAGLLASHGEGLYQFPHRSFQEYLAACHLARFKFPDELCRLVKTDPNRWREVALLAAARSKDTPSAIWELVEELCAKDEPPPETAPESPAEAQWGALLAAQILDETGLATPDPSLQDRHERKRLRVRDWQLRVLGGRTLPPRERALSGDLLENLGDPRTHLLDVDEMRFCLVPGGAFWMGEEGEIDAPLHRNETLGDDFWIAQAPVTVAQFAQFMLSSNDRPAERDGAGVRKNRPVVNLSWQDAREFCNWLTKRWQDRLPAGWAVMLPSEAEWEKAARGGERLPAVARIETVRQGLLAAKCDWIESSFPQRRYPWGQQAVEGNANWLGTVNNPSTPGCFETGRSPYACDDLAGNVFEWTRSTFADYPYRPDDGRENVETAFNKGVVVRGGSWRAPQDLARCAYRNGNRPVSRHHYLGFRVVLRASPVS